MAATAVDDVADEEVTVLETLAEADGPTRRVALADEVEAPDEYPRHERALLEREAIEEVGKETLREDGRLVTYRRFRITDTGERLLDQIKTVEETGDPDPVAPTTRETRQRFEDHAEWTQLTEHVPRFIDETESVERVEADDVRYDYLVRVTLTREDSDQTAVAEFSNVTWHTDRGRQEFLKAYRNAFGDAPRMDGRTFGVLQARWLTEFADEN